MLIPGHRYHNIISSAADRDGARHWNNGRIYGPNVPTVGDEAGETALSATFGFVATLAAFVAGVAGWVVGG